MQDYEISVSGLPAGVAHAKSDAHARQMAAKAFRIMNELFNLDAGLPVEPNLIRADEIISEPKRLASKRSRATQ